MANFKILKTPYYVPVVDGVRKLELGLYPARRAALAQVVGRLGDAEQVYLGDRAEMTTLKNKQHTMAVMTPRQALRMTTGRKESIPSDYSTHATEDSRKILKAIHGNEDRRAMKTLQEWW